MSEEGDMLLPVRGVFVLMLLFSFGPQKQLLILCSELETHVKCDIRESEKCLYRSKVSTTARGSSAICVYLCVF